MKRFWLHQVRLCVNWGLSYRIIMWKLCSVTSVVKNWSTVLSYFIATPPYRVWQRSEGRLLLHSFLSLDMLVNSTASVPLVFANENRYCAKQNIGWAKFRINWICLYSSNLIIFKEERGRRNDFACIKWINAISKACIKWIAVYANSFIVPWNLSIKIFYFERYRLL